MIEQLEFINKMLKETGDELVSARLSITPSKAATTEDVWNQVHEFDFKEGWLCLTDAVFPLYSAADLIQYTGKTILSGELTKAGGESLHIRQAEEGWLITKFKEGEGDECLKLTEEFISTEESNSLKLVYDVYWKLLDDQLQPHAACFQPYVSRFVGFKMEGNDDQGPI